MRRELNSFLSTFLILGMVTLFLIGAIYQLAVVAIPKEVVEWFTGSNMSKEAASVFVPWNYTTGQIGNCTRMDLYVNVSYCAVRCNPGYQLNLQKNSSIIKGLTILDNSNGEYLIAIKIPENNSLQAMYINFEKGGNCSYACYGIHHGHSC